MPEIIPHLSDAASRFFVNYINCLDKAAIPEKQKRWYVKHVDAFIKGHHGRKIKSLTSGDINDYFATIGRQKQF